MYSKLFSTFPDTPPPNPVGSFMAGGAKMASAFGMGDGGVQIPQGWERKKKERSYGKRGGRASGSGSIMYSSRLAQYGEG